MVSQAIDEGLLVRIQSYVATDIKSRVPALSVTSKDVYVLSFSRVLNNWKATVTVPDDIGFYYELVHDGSADVTIATIYKKQVSNPAVI